jgi:hypothetical protein
MFVYDNRPTETYPRHCLGRKPSVQVLAPGRDSGLRVTTAATSDRMGCAGLSDCISPAFTTVGKTGRYLIDL